MIDQISANKQIKPESQAIRRRVGNKSRDGSSKKTNPETKTAVSNRIWDPMFLNTGEGYVAKNQKNTIHIS